MVVGVLVFFSFDFLLCFTCIRFFRNHYKLKQSKPLTEALLDNADYELPNLAVSKSWIPSYGRSDVHPVSGFHFPINSYKFTRGQQDPKNLSV